MRIVLLGSSGYVGSEFRTQIAARNGELVSIGRSDCNVYDAKQLSKHLHRLSADALINCAGYTGKPNVDACELDKTNCLAGNAVLPGVIAEVCANLDIPWGHVSSGCIYTGRREDGDGFSEADPPNFSFRQDNCSFYSGTKALGEEMLVDAPKCFVWRLRIPFSNVDGPRNYLTKVMRYNRLLQAENSLSNLSDFVSAALDCFENKVPYGIYNLTNPGSVTTRQVVQWIQESGVCDKEFEFFENEEDFMAKAASTPRSNCVLDSSKAVAAGLSLPPVDESVKAALQAWISESTANA
ncbi:dTDP-4-dehydrorhamnose reductase [Roseimaritima multifibrata]|uniref:dTDP-4-dehydrorhamnose reductase n=1 Tax=Roseimaritima multifibrata TaxID=1930274 RepID=A0A517MMI9_9BACT|nr:sugar nucleotide-binding protein [Roseimaritima multifibrata]QDS96091.1 dTDP-4-dehydrorhamnose reductase [Roseimaritima multifibrata]